MGIFDPQGLPSSPTSQSSTSSGIASWAQPYVNNYLSNALLLANQGPTGFQNQVYSSAQNMGMPEQFGMGTSLANRGGEGQLSTAPMALNYGQMGATTGAQGIGIGQAGMQYGMNAGQNYANQATNPGAVGAYMNPYIQQSLAPQLQLLNQQQQLGSQDINARAAGQGAFGGNRATLAQGLNAQNYALAGQQAIGQGYNEAFRNAQQAQQFGANLGLQGAMQGTAAGLSGLDTALRGTSLGLQGVSGAQAGYSGATQAGAALGNIGAQQGQYELAKLALQNQIANQQYNQPFQNVEFQRNMLSGLPVSSSTTQGYTAGPNKLSQLTGALGAAGSYAPGIFNYAKDLYKSWNSGGGGSGITYGDDGYTTSAGNFIDPNEYSGGMAEGGEVKRYAEGGITSINRRVMNDPTAYSEQTIDRGAQNGVLGGVTKLLALDTIAKQRAAMQNQQAMQQQPSPSVMAQLQQQAAQPGIDSAESNLPQQYAGGGIIAFEEGGTTPRSAFREDLSRFADYAVPNLGIVKRLKELGSYFTTPRQAPTDADAQPGGLYGSGSNVAPEIQVKPDSGIIIHPNAPRTVGPSAPTAPTAPPVATYKPADTSGIDALTKGYESMIRGGEDFKKAESDADRSAFRKTMLGLMAGKSPYFFSNLGEAGLAAQEGLDKTLEGIQARKDKQIAQLMGLGLKGEDLKNAARKMGIDEAELQGKLPTYAAEANYKNEYAKYLASSKGKGAGSANLGGSLGEATVDKIMERYDAYRADYKNPNNPYVAMLSPQDQIYLKEGKGKSLATARKKLDEVIDAEQQKRLNTLSGYKQKRPVE
jgi:hypothetical protein